MIFLPSLLRWLPVIAALAVPCGFAAEDDEQKQEKPKPLTGRVVFKKEPLRRMTLYYPEGWKAEDKRPALVIFRCRIEAHRGAARAFSEARDGGDQAGYRAGEFG